MIDECWNRKLKILVIEDNPGDVLLLKLALKAAELDCEFVVVTDGGAALAFVKDSENGGHAPVFDLAVLDLNLPKNDGLEVLDAMRASRLYRNVPVAVLSSSSSRREQAKIERIRTARYITKPPTLDEYLAVGRTIKKLFLESGSRAAAAGA